MAPLINGRNLAREYFAIGNDGLQVVRMENDKGEAVQNEYVFPTMRSASFQTRVLWNNGPACLNRKTRQVSFLPLCS
jgi:hypothetical protein